MLINRIVALVLAILLLATMTACGAEDIPLNDEINNITSEINSDDNGDDTSSDDNDSSDDDNSDD